MGIIFSGIILFIIISLLLANIRIVSQSHAFVIERLGAYKTTWSTGIHVKIPLIDRVSNKISLKEKVMDFPPQSVITKDNVTVDIDTVIYYQILDPKLYTYGAEQPLIALKNLTATTLRNLLGDLELDQTLTSRDTINGKLRSILDEATDAWGIKVNRVEIKDIIPPKEIQLSMEKQMKAERDRREKILQAEGDKNSQILRAEGDKESTVLEAQADYEKVVLDAKAQKEWNIKQAEGEAEAIRVKAQAEADGIKLINEAKATKEYLTLKSFEALTKLGDGQATKIIVPSEIQNLAGLITSVKEVSSNDLQPQEVASK